MFNYYLNKFVSNICCKLFLKKINGLKNLPTKGGYIVAANHVSYLDIWVMYVMFLDKAKTYIRFIAKRRLVKDAYFRITKFLFGNEKNKVIILNAKMPEKAFKESTTALKKESIVCIYPEGERSPNGRIQKGKTGMIRLALLAKVPIIPVGLKGTFELMPKGKSMPKIKKNVIISIGKPIYLDYYYNRKMTKKLLRKLTDDVMKNIAKLIGQEYNY
jgi:1-acyl-sn-glycerol-3-phosphate acyltransferase|tara:strand:+ start:3067 stop:3714 length:648 start_codon:yes stop_codon:yes gene_type:complete